MNHRGFCDVRKGFIAAGCTFALASGCSSREFIGGAETTLDAGFIDDLAAPEFDAGLPDAGLPVETIDSGDGRFLPESPCPSPSFGAPVSLEVAPPPVSGGTLVVSRDGTKAYASDPDRDLVYVVDLLSKSLTFAIALEAGDEPGRLAEDGAGRVHVALRGSGVLATVDPTAGTVESRRTLCPAPRGVAWQSSSDVVWVACATGELVSLPASGGSGSIQKVARDLRDVVVNGDSLTVTQFRSAQVLRLAGDHATVARTDLLPPPDTSSSASHVLWRAVEGPAGSIVTVHQAESTESVSTAISGGYGCSGFDSLFGGDDGGLFSFPTFGDGGLPLLAPGLAESAVTSVVAVLGSDGTIRSNLTFPNVLPVDVAVSPDGSLIAAVGAGDGSGDAESGSVTLLPFPQSKTFATLAGHNAFAGQTTTVAFASNSEVLVQTREPAQLWFFPVYLNADGSSPSTSIGLSKISRRDTGHDIFHTHTGAQLACASCHPEGGDDGHTWVVDGVKRRTSSLRGTIAGTAPYHWSGDEKDFTAIVHDVYERRMAGSALSNAQVAALSGWVNAIPPPKAPAWVDANAAQAGQKIFARTDVGCATCHSGPKFTNNATVDVGTGGSFQVPPLIGVGWRTPIMHDACASTIADRFGRCSTVEHGNIASLSAQDLANLTAYLETL